MSFDLEDETAAYHEAGHVLMAHLCGGFVRETTIESELDEHHGHTVVEWHGLSDSERVERSAIVALAGPVAEVTWRGEDVFEQDLSAWRADWDEADAALTRVAPHERDTLRRSWLRRIAESFDDAGQWEILCRIADAIEAHGTLDRALLEDLLYGGMSPERG